MIFGKKILIFQILTLMADESRMNLRRAAMAMNHGLFPCLGTEKYKNYLKISNFHSFLSRQMRGQILTNF